MLQNVALPVVFFYPNALDPQPLISALGEVLSHYPIFAGRLRQGRDHLTIECNDSGVATSVRQSASSQGEILQNFLEHGHTELVEPVVPRAASRGGSALMTVRITHFRDKGSALGICWHHPLGDMATLIRFMQAWSQTAIGKPTPAPLIVSDRHAYLAAKLEARDNERSGLRFLAPWELAQMIAYLAFPARRRSPIAVYFTENELEAMRAAQQQEAGRKLSRNDVLCGHVASMIIRHDPNVRRHVVAILINWRARLGLPEELLGNLIGFLNVDCDPASTAVEIASRIRVAVDQSVEKHFDYFGTAADFIRHGGAPKAWRMIPKGLDPIRGTLTITNWSRFGVYDVTFGGQRPTLFIPTGDPPFPWVSTIFEGPENQGLIFGASLPTRIVKALTSPERLDELHRYRPPGDAGLESARTLPFLC